MRNQYGVWNQQRWLRSARSSFLRDKPTPAPLERQPYYQRMKELASQSTEWYGGRKPQSDLVAKADARRVKAEPPSASAKGQKGKRVPEPNHVAAQPPTTAAAQLKEGERYEMKGVREVAVPEALFDRHSYSEWKAVVADSKEFASVIPQDDPYHQERDLSVYAGGDIRYFGINASEAILDSKKMRTWLMGADIGVRLKPTSLHNVSAVIEGRFLNSSANQDPEDGFAGTAMAKSAYLLIDDMAYDSTFQAGLYRPLFGLYDPNHDSLASQVTGLTQRALYKGFGFTTAPNVPFLVANYIQPYKRGGNEYQTSDGYVVTAGGRFVSYGASISASLWNTQFTKIGDTNTYKRQMMSFDVGGTLGRFILNVQALRAQLESSNGAKNAGNVSTVQGKMRVWRENYLVANYAMSNVARDLSDGSGTETTFGVKTFPLSDVEIEGLYVSRNDDDGGTKTKVNLVQVQAHIFF